jgi:hypothetical protein
MYGARDRARTRATIELRGLTLLFAFSTDLIEKELLVTCQVCISCLVLEVVPCSQGLPIKSPIYLKFP